MSTTINTNNTQNISIGGFGALPLKTEEFKTNIEAMLNDGFQAGYDTAYVSGQILDEVQQNPQEAAKLGLKNDYQWIKNKIVDNYNLYSQAGTTKSVEDLSKKPSPFVLKVSEHGKKDSPTSFNAEMDLYQEGKLVMRTEGNSWPDKLNLSPGIQSGTYLSKFGWKAHKGNTVPGLVLNQNNFIPTLGPNPNQLGKPYATAIHVHAGGNRDRGSDGCLTIPKSQAYDMWNAIQTEGAEVIIVLERPLSIR